VPEIQNITNKYNANTSATGTFDTDFITLCLYFLVNLMLFDAAFAE